jgi:CheY-like chemotaxis protein
MCPATLSIEPWHDGVRRPPRFEPRLAKVLWSINVLLVEDDAADTDLILNVLKRHPDVSAIQASNEPARMLRQLTLGQVKPDLILLDIHMPRVNGFKFLEALREIPAMNSVPVVFLTTSCLAKDVLEAGRSSAASYVIKPDTYFELQTRLDGVIKRAIAGLWGG